MSIDSLPTDIITVRCLGIIVFLAAMAWWLRRGRHRAGGWIVLPVALVAALLVPMAYSASRAVELEAELRAYASQGQWQRARRAARRLQTLNPQLRIESRSIRLIAFELDERVSHLEQEATAFSAADASTDERLQQAIRLASLERFGEATAIVEPLAPRAEACNLLGTIYEHQQRWPVAREWYERALKADGAGSSTEAHRLRALVGIGYTERKLGHLRDAEAAWLQAIELRPTADLHFLVAQFYRDTQQASAAHQHIVRAIELAPERYREEGHRLNEELMTSHFGCAAVWSAN